MPVVGAAAGAKTGTKQPGRGGQGHRSTTKPPAVQRTHLTELTTADDDLNYGDIYFTVFPIPRAVVADLLEREHNPLRVVLNVNGQGTIQRGLMADGKGDFFITVSKETRKRFGLELHDEVHLTIAPDDSQYGIELPAELAELWELDEEARTLFHRLTTGKQRGLIYMVDKPKGAATRVKKAVQITEYLRSTGGVLDYKELNAYMKADNANW